MLTLYVGTDRRTSVDEGIHKKTWWADLKAMLGLEWKEVEATVERGRGKATRLKPDSNRSKVDKVTNVMERADVSTWSGLYPSMYHPSSAQFTSCTLNKRALARS
jgi:hypothetical protein